MTRGNSWRTAATAALLASHAADSFSQPSSNVQIYGFLAPMIDRISVSGAAAIAPLDRPSMLGAGAYNGRGNVSLLRMQSSTTNFGFRGTEDLGGGLRALFQLETGFQVDDGSWTGSATGPVRAFNRNSRVGLAGAFGTVFGGIWDTPAAWSHLGLTSGLRNPYAGDSSSIFLTPGFNIPHSFTADTRTNGPGDATFNRRQGNSVQYWSPDWAGVSFRVAYGLPEGQRTAANGARYAPTVLGLGVEYAAGPVVLRYVHQQQRDYFGLAWLGPNPAANPDAPGSTANGSKDSNHRLIARYNIDKHWSLQGAFDRLDYRAHGVARGAVNGYSRNAYSAQLLYRLDSHTAWFNLGQARDGECTRSGGGACSTRDLGAHMWSVGYRYDLSRRTDVFASAYRISNRASGQYGVFPRIATGIAPGSRQTGVTLGLEHSF